jgi:anti-sigma-K factor RskA
MGFQLWLRKDDVRLSAGVFQVDATGSGTLVFHVPEPLDTLDALGITTEPVGGSEGPTGQGVVRFARESQ